MQEISREIADLERDRIEFTEDLYFVTAPFGINAAPPGSAALNLALKTSKQPVPGDFAAAALGQSLQRAGNNMSAANLGRSLMNQAASQHFQGGPPGMMGMSGHINAGMSRSGFAAPGMGMGGMGLGDEGMVPPPKPGTNNELMYVFWISLAIGLFEIVMMFKKYNFLNVSYQCIVVTGCVLYSVDLPAELLRQKLCQSLSRPNRLEHPARPNLAVHLRLNFLVASPNRLVCEFRKRLPAAYSPIHNSFPNFKSNFQQY
jgi:hypothetical protein